MRFVPPRLSLLLHLLICSENPIPVLTIADKLGVSKRTVFRELENSEILLQPYGLYIDTKPGEGIYLQGTPEGLEQMRKDLGELKAQQPANKQERLTLLLLELLATPEQQKLFYYANRLQVSNATISHDLDSLQPWFQKYNLELVRKTGYGVAVLGREMDFRIALCGVLGSLHQEQRMTMNAFAYPSPDIVQAVHQLLDARFSRYFSWMTDDSKKELERYLGIAIQRVRSGYDLTDEQPGTESSHQSQANMLADALELQFNSTLSQTERDGIAVYLAACRTVGKLQPGPDSASYKFRLQRLVFQMIERFDHKLSPLLKLDDQLLDGLINHLPSTMIRMQNHVEMQDPLLEQISSTYPDILEKSRHALEVLEEFDPQIPDSETSFLATHFIAAIMRLREHGDRRKNTKVGIVCWNGVGMSYMMASQVKKEIGHRCSIEVCGLGDDIDWKQYDFVISAHPLGDVPVRVIEVRPILTQEDIQHIHTQFNEGAPQDHNKTHPPVQRESLIEKCTRLEQLLGDVRFLLQHFDILQIEADGTFQQLAKLVGYRFGETPEDGKLIYEGLMERERISSQVIPELKLILLHTRTQAVKGPLFSLIIPQGGSFTDPALKETRACVTMLAPLEINRQRTELMGCISSSLMEDSHFFTAVIEGNRPLIRARLEENLKGFLSHYTT